MSHKAKMCKSPKNIVYTQSDKIEYENLNTNCTIVGSNNLHLVKKPQIVTSMSPAYSNPSPGYPQSPYSSPGLKSPSPQQNLKPPTPQPNTFPVMQIIHNSHPVMARPIHATSQQQNVIKLKPPLNILPKPSASPQQSPKPSVSPQIVLPANQQATIMPASQPLLLNQMPMLAPGVQFILRPQATKLPAQVQQTPQGLILQPSGQQLLHLQPPRSQPMVRVLTNGVGLPTTTYVTQMTPQPTMHQTTPSVQNTTPKKKPNKKKKQKLDLANIMKLSGIGDDDDVQFESDASQSESEHNIHSQPATPQPAPPTPTATIMQPTPQVVQSQGSVVQSNIVQGDKTSKVGNIHISAVPQTINTTGAPLVQVLNQTFQGGSQPQSAQPTSIPFNPFIAPNFTINNGLMVQRSGGFKLALGEDGRTLVLQHDPTLNQDLQSQLLLQSLFGINGGLVLQPSIDQHIHSQTVQTIQQQSVQTIQQQTVQSQTIQTVQHQIVQPQTIQSIQSQIQGQIQSLLQQQNLGSQSIAIQPQNITIQPQGIQGLQVSQPLSIQSQPIAIQSQSQSQPITIQAQSQPITIQSQSQPITIQSQCHSQPLPLPNNIGTQSQIINLSQANQIYTGNNVSSHNVMHLQSQPHTVSSHTPTIPQVQVSNHAPPTQTTTQPQTTIIQHPQTFLQNNTQSQPSQGSLGTQPVLKVQPFQKTQPPVQTVHPIHHHNSQQQQTQQQQPPPTSYVVNLTPEQLEQLKRNGQLTVNGQTIFMQRPKTEEIKKTSPKIKPIKKVPKITATTTTASVVKDTKAINNFEKTINSVVKDSVKTTSLVSTQTTPTKSTITQTSVQSQVITPKSQPSAVIQPSVQPQAQVIQPKIQITQPKMHVQPNIQPSNVQPVENPPNNQEVERFLGQLMDETQPTTNQSTSAAIPSNSIVINTSTALPTNPNQRVHTIQLTPQKQQHLKSIQLQIQTLSARMTPGNTEMQNALKLLFQEQQKILATGKLLPPDKVFYHNNQLIVNNSIGLVKNEPVVTQSRIPVATSASTGATETMATSVLQAPNLPHAVNIQPKVNVPTTTASDVVLQTSAPPVQKVTSTITTTTTTTSAATQQPPNRFIPLYTKAQLIEQQLNTDQNGAIKPDIQTPFKDKADACKRLIRYHCFDQPVLSQKDLNKADEIFELTARHFIDKFGRMVDKYRFLLHKESQRHVQTSELMMLDRMFLAEEQQSLIRLRQELDECNLEMQHAAMAEAQLAQEGPNATNEEYDEWACIQRELGCLPINEEANKATTSAPTSITSNSAMTIIPSASTQQQQQALKRSCSGDSRLESLKKFRVEKHCKKVESVAATTNSDSVKSQSAQQFVPSSTIQTSSTNVHCTSVLTSSSIVHGTASMHSSSTNYQSNSNDCSQPQRVMHGHTSTNVMSRAIAVNNGPNCTVTSSRTSSSNTITTAVSVPARSNSSDSSVPCNSVSGNSNMLHNLHNSLQSYNSTAMHIQNPMQRVHGLHSTLHHQNIHPLQHVVHNSTQQALLQRGVHNMQHYSTQHIVQHITHTVHHTQQIQNSLHGSTGSVHSQNSVHHSSSVHSQNSYSSGNEELDNNDSIDEQVQSAIDSILNLQQNTSLELDETMQNMLS